MELLFQQFSLYPTMLISLFSLDMLHERSPDEFHTLKTDGKTVCFLEFATFPLHNESIGIGLILTHNDPVKVFPAFMRLEKYEDGIGGGGYELLQYIEIKDSEYRDKFNGDFRSSIGNILREIE